MPVDRYCWRCKLMVPMLTDEEHENVLAKANGDSEALSLAIKEITGRYETSPYALFHHVSRFFGPDCQNCGRPLRTPKASYCAECGHYKLPAKVYQIDTSKN